MKCLEIYSFTGPSGTGKSTVALYVADKYNIDAFIDDGLLIINGQKKAGVSAKFEKNTVTAVRRAIFSDDAHCEDVAHAIQQTPIQRLMIIGTSDKMTRKIAERLGLSAIDHFHYVSEFRTQNEMDYARFVRLTQGQHVMPLPHMQVEQNFFKRLIKKGWDIISQRGKIGETTLVRPDFQYETIDIATRVYTELIRHELEKQTIVAKVDKITLDAQTVPRFQVTIQIVPTILHIPSELIAVQQHLYTCFHEHFTYYPLAIDITVKAIYEA